ncbi:peptidoglycan-binding protein [Kitasatospora sp. NPDC056446]|uniref:peptidoglycan-binding protein n=1 Tax=Kitasatospora sp. NPDC056446 TaxID=3345819 RepID=UPI0036A4DD39
MKEEHGGDVGQETGTTGAGGDGEPPGERAGRPPRGRRRALALVAAGAVAVTSGGLLASLWIKSPAQAAAEAKPPAPDLLTAQVDRRVVTSTVICRGTVTAGQSVDVAPVAGGAGTRAVVTRLPLKAGDAVAAGQPIVEVSGRPVFALPGELPVYRDLKPGSKGQDVSQLQRALRTLGFGTRNDPDGTFGAGTSAAVTAFYQRQGYDPLPALADADAQVSAARDAVTAADQALTDAKDGLASAPSSGTGTGTGTAPGGGGTAAPVDPAHQANGQRQVDRAAENATRLRKKLTDLQALVGPLVPAAELVYLSGFPARVESVSGRVGGEVSGKVMTVSAGTLLLQGTLGAADHGLVHAGQKVDMLSELTGEQYTGVVASVAESPGGGAPQAGGAGASGTQAGAGGGTGAGTVAGYQVSVLPDRLLDPRSAGQSVRLTVVAASSAQPVLVVPVSAISATADGRTVVTVSASGQRRQVEVTPGTVGGGSVQVTPVAAGALSEGEQVIVGVKAVGGP